MKKSFLFILSIFFLSSCKEKINDECTYTYEINQPKGYDLSSISEINYNGFVKSFQFINNQVGYVLMTNPNGSYAEVLKTTDGGLTWTDMNLAYRHFSRNMVFKDENIGVITVHDTSGCPPPNCEHKCVILKTEDGGLTWEEIEIQNLKGILYHPQYDSQGNLYALLGFDGQYTMVKSTDDGDTWQEFYRSDHLGFSLLTFSYKIFDDKFYISTRDKDLLVIDLNGEYVKTIYVGKRSFWDVEIIDENNIIVVVEDVLKTMDGGETWETIYNRSARVIGFNSVNEGLMILNKSNCEETDVYQVNDLIASTSDGGYTWTEPKKSTTNLMSDFEGSQKMSNNLWYIMIGNQLMEIKK